MKLFQINSFTKESLKGNPAGVCLMDDLISEDVMQKIATEMNLSETAFIRQNGDLFDIRYYTPTKEVPMCGHATLASAHILYELGVVDKKDIIIFKAKEADLKIEFVCDWIRMFFPLYKIHEISDYKIINNIFNINALEVYKSDNNWHVIFLEKQEDIIKLNPNYELIVNENIGDLFAVTSPSNSLEYDFVVRVFCNPTFGITEDPVTGSANCILAPFWEQRLHKTNFVSKQISKRSGIIKTSISNNHVIIMGQAKTVFEMKLMPDILLSRKSG